ncbi:Pr6Pr family membrane protein [Microbacterium sp. JZ70]
MPTAPAAFRVQAGPIRRETREPRTCPLHIVFPALALVDWLVAPDRPRLPWRELWVVFPYLVLWLAVVLVRGAVDGWVPYGFLLPERGAGSLVAHVVGLLVALTAAGALVWGMSRIPRGTDSGARRAG